MSVGGRLIEILPVRLDDGTEAVRLWAVDRNGDETCVHAEPQATMPKLGDEVWWQAGRIMFDGDRQTLRKIGNSFAALPPSEDPTHE